VLIRPSPLGATLVGAVHALAVFAVIVALPAWAALICALGLALSAIVHAGAMLRWWRTSICELVLRPDGGAEWREADGSWHVATEVTGGALASWLLVVGLREERGRLRHMLLLPDALEAGACRELRVWLRWRPAITPADERKRDLRHIMAKDPSWN